MVRFDIFRDTRGVSVFLGDPAVTFRPGDPVRCSFSTNILRSVTMRFNVFSEPHRGIVSGRETIIVCVKNVMSCTDAVYDRLLNIF